MDIIISHMQGRVPVTVFRIEERVNLGNAEELETAARQAVQNGMRDLLIDLTGVPSITSAGLRSLQIIYKLLSDPHLEQTGEVTQMQPGSPSLKSQHLKLVNPSPYVRKVLHTAGFDMFLDIYENLPDAVASF
jgi:anti-anti-sigma regulatory factor